MHVWASFLKLWLRELKTPLIDGEEAYASAIDAATTHLDNIRAAEEAAEQALVSASQSDLRKPRATSMGDMNAIAAAAAAAVAAEESERSPPLRTVKRPPFASSFDAFDSAGSDGRPRDVLRSCSLPVSGIGFRSCPGRPFSGAHVASVARVAQIAPNPLAGCGHRGCGSQRYLRHRAPSCALRSVLSTDCVVSLWLAFTCHR